MGDKNYHINTTKDNNWLDVAAEWEKISNESLSCK
jgi:hypothetical protein